MAKASALGPVNAVMLGVSDIHQSIDFYKNRLKFETIMEADQIALFKAGTTTIGLSPGLAKNSDHLAGAIEVVFSVDNVSDSYTYLQDSGVRFIQEPKQVTQSDWAATFTDPDGHKLSIFGPK